MQAWAERSEGSEIRHQGLKGYPIREVSTSSGVEVDRGGVVPFGRTTLVR